MPGSLAELYGALLKQEPQGVLGAARFNPLMMAKALRQQQANPRPSLSSLMNYPQTWQQFGDNIQANYPIDSPAAVRQAAFEAAKNAGPLMTVWHGSPHRFAPTERNPLGEFDASKIGTGEGKQQQAVGTYLAQVKDVGQKYADKEAAKRAMNSGHLYKVDLPDEIVARMANYETKVMDQPESVKNALKNVISADDLSALKSYYGWNSLEEAPMQAVMDAMDIVRGNNRALTSKDLLGAGIPGIRYLDQGSRGAGSGTSNFVVFPGNEGALRILARE